MSTSTHRRYERLRHDQADRVWRNRKRHDAMNAACPACQGNGTPDGCWWCGETPTSIEYVDYAADVRREHADRTANLDGVA